MLFPSVGFLIFLPLILKWVGKISYGRNLAEPTHKPMRGKMRIHTHRIIGTVVANFSR